MVAVKEVLDMVPFEDKDNGASGGGRPGGVGGR